LGKLDERYPHELVVVGVHSPKYTAEKDPDGVRSAVERNHIRHPVVNDPEMRVWDSYAVNAWPTLVFLSPDGYVIGRHAGEAPVEALAAALDALIAELEPSGELDRRPLDLGVRLEPRPLSELSFPGKVLATADRLFIADSGHHRVLLADHDGSVSDVVGSGQEGRGDGSWEAATFSAPQGMALDQTAGLLYVADSESHCIRALSLERRDVRTVAGTGGQARRVTRHGPARETALSSPWDVTLSAGRLFIAMAGTHQLWMFDPAEEMVGVWAGTGHEGIRDGPREMAWLAQPMGIAAFDRDLFVACAETQAVRHVSLDTDTVETVAGLGLFEWGEVDGPAASALFQHNHGVAAGPAALYVADTYNNRIRYIDLRTRQVATLAGSGRAGLLDGPLENARFNQPSGLALQGRTLFVADANNHAVRAVDLESGHVRTLRVSGL
jgi:sugar lactone lactonase YvrE